LSRSYLETISKIFTGSDCDTRRPLNRHLLEMGLVGEGTVDNKVWIVKSHFPERLGRCEFSANKCIVVVRNPLDCFASLFNMIATQSHDKSMPPEELTCAIELGIWGDFVSQEAEIWRAFHEYWLRKP
jgi:hypothetical protein